MKHSTKGGFIALAIITGLTASKFILYAVSGSIAVLSEAWHSFADIATTLLVVISIIRQDRKERCQNGSPQITGGDPTEQIPKPEESRTRPEPAHKRLLAWLHAINTELKVSLLISLVLLSAASTILWNAVTSEPAEISLPLVTGLIFICLSFGSFFLFRFEESIGREEKSAALTADSHHNRADMAISLLTGISLILCYFGYNYDRWAGIAISAYILASASELLVNTIVSIRHNNPEVVIKYRFVSIIFRMFKADSYRFATDLIDVKTVIGRRLKQGLSLVPVIRAFVMRWTLRLGLAAGLLFYISTMFYTVDPNEQAILLRFGEVVNQDAAILPGLHLKLPYPIDSAVKFPAREVKSLVVGNSLKEGPVMIWTKEHGDNLTFISGDNNLFLPFIVIHYKIKNIHDYYLANGAGVPEKIISATTYRLINHLFIKTTFYDLILHKRKQWTSDMKSALQRELDQLKAGLEVIDFCLIDMHPPSELAAFYEEVVAADQLRETYLNNAERRVVSNKASARMNAHKTVTEAKSYVVEKRSLAQGEAENYLLRHKGYQVGGETHKHLLILEAAKKALKDRKMVLIDPKSGIDDKLIYIENNLAGGRRR